MNRFQSSGIRSIGAITLACMVVASMIGFGVFTSSGFALSAVGNPGRVMFAWTLCGVWAVCGAIGYGALASRAPYSGGEYLFLSRLVHPSVGFLAGWISLVAGFTAPLATAAKTAAVYCYSAAEGHQELQCVVASGLLLLATLAYLANLSVGTAVQNSVVILKLVLVFGLCVWAFGLTPAESWRGSALPDRDTGWWPENSRAWVVLLGSMSWISLSYTGFNAAIYVAGQSQAAQRSVPRAMLLATILVMFVYLLLNTIFVYGPPAESIANQEAVAAIASRSLGGANMETITRVIIALALISSVFSLLLAGPRVYWQMARDGVMPRILDTDSEVPRAAVIVQCALSLVAIWIASIPQLLAYLGLTLSACSALTIATIWRLSTIIPDSKSLRWWEHLSAIVYILGTVLMFAAATNLRPDEFKACLITVGAGALVYGVWWWAEKSGSRQAMKRESGM